MIYTIPLKKTADVAYFVSLFLSMLKNCIYYYIQRLNIKNEYYQNTYNNLSLVSQNWLDKALCLLNSSHCKFF